MALTSKEIVDVIEAELIRQNKTKGEFFAACNVTRAQMSNWRREKNFPQTPVLITISNYLGINLLGTKAPLAEDGEGRYGLTSAEWKVIGHQFRNALAEKAKAPAYLSNDKTGLSEEEAELFLDGKHQVSKDQITEMAALLGKSLKDLIGAYELAFDRPDNASPAVRLKELASQFPPEVAEAALRLYELSKSSPDSVSMYSAVLDQALKNRK